MDMLLRGFRQLKIWGVSVRQPKRRLGGERWVRLVRMDANGSGPWDGLANDVGGVMQRAGSAARGSMRGVARGDICAGHLGKDEGFLEGWRTQPGRDGVQRGGAVLARVRHRASAQP